MGTKFQLLEDLERIIDSGYGSDGNEKSDKGIDEEQNLIERRLRETIDSLIQAGVDVRELFDNGKTEDAISALGGVIDHLSNALSEMKGE